MKAPTLKHALIMVAWSALTPALLLIERSTGITWPVTLISGTLTWLATLLLCAGVWVMYKALAEGDKFNTYEVFSRVDTAVKYHLITLTLSFLLTLATTCAMYVAGHTVIAMTAVVSMLMSLCIHLGRMEIEKKFYAMSWEERSAIKKHFDGVEIRRAQLEARVSALAKAMEN